MKITTLVLLSWSFLFCLEPQYEVDDGTLPLPKAQLSSEVVKSEKPIQDHGRNGETQAAEHQPSMASRWMSSLLIGTCNSASDL